MSRLDYGFNQWSDVSLVIKKLYVHLFMVKLYISSYTHVLHASTFSPFTIWEKIYRFCRISDFFVDPIHSVNYQKMQKDSKSKDKTQLQNK